MGYTHYFPQTKNFTNDQWEKVKVGTKKILGYCNDKGIILQYEYNNPKDPQVDNHLIRLNGVEDAGHETFLLKKNLFPSHAQGEVFQFCKTAYKPYDLAVCMVLLLIKDVAPDVLKVSSDGNDEDWKPAKEAYDVLFGQMAVA